MQASTGYSELVASRISSPSNFQVIVGLSVIYFCEFIKVHLGPVLYGGLTAVLKGLMPGLLSPTASPQASHLHSIDDIIAQEAQRVEKERYKSSQDDKKSSKGSENDIYMLKTHGYNKYRFVSPSFIQRNKLNGAEED